MAKNYLSSFLKKSPEEQAKEIEKETKALLKRLPELKKRLKMYGETSDELYNLSQEELQLMGSTYSKAVVSGEISTPSSQKAYQQFVSNLKKYSSANISELASQVAGQRMDSWLEHIQKASTTGDYDYAKSLVEDMTDGEKEGFTKSKYFMDSTYMYMVTEENDTQYSIQTLKLELYLEEVRNKTTKHIYRKNVKKSEEKLRKYRRRRK